MPRRSDKASACSGEVATGSPMRTCAKTRVVAGAVLLASVLAGCSDLYYDRRQTVLFGADEAVASAQAVQVIDPWPAASANRTSLRPSLSAKPDGSKRRSAMAVP